MKVVFGMNDFLVGGMQRLFADQTRFFNRREFDGTLITLFQFPGEEDFYASLPPDLTVHRLNFSGVRDLRSWWRLYRLLRQIRPDIVVSNLFFSNTVFRVLKPFVGYHVIACEHNTYTGKTPWQRFVDRTLARISDRIVAVSTTVAAFTAKQEGIPSEKFIVIHNGIDLDKIHREIEALPSPEAIKQELGFQTGDRILLDVARLMPQKNLPLLIDGFALFRRTHPAYKLAIVGGGSWQSVIQDHADKQGPDGAITLFGSQQDVWKYYKIADVFVSTSFIEGFGLAHAEALACGVPVVTTKTAGPDEMIEEGKNGFFINADTPEAVAGALEKVIAADYPSMSAAARASVQKYSVKRAAEAYEDLFRDVCKSNNVTAAS